jgi:tetratricopeptide (TPR) repeat protein
MSAEPYVLTAEDIGLRGHVRGLTPAVAGFATTAGVAWANGGYFPTAWGGAAVVSLGVAFVALVRGRAALTGADRLFAGALVALLAWTALSVLWSRSVPGTVLEVERTLAYAAAGLALLLVATRENAGRILGGALAGICMIAAYAAGTRLFPDRLGSFDPAAEYRLAQPLGYWNGLGLYCAIGLLIALGLAARQAPRQLRACAAAPVPLLATALFFTFSRGAWAACAIGLGAMLLLGRERLRLVATAAALAPASAVAVALASRSHALTRQGSALAEASREGHRLAPALALLMLASALSLLGLAALPRRAQRAIVLALVLVCAGAVAGGVAVRGVHGLTAKPARDGNLNHRVVSLSSDGRMALWRLAVADAGSAPLLGSGAGTYEQFFYEHRDTPALNVRDAHSLYLETLAELGPAGLVLLLLALGLPLAAAVRARGDGVAVAAAGAYVAYLAHAAWDWDWELPAVTLTALLAAAVLLAKARGARRRPLGRGRYALAAALVVPAVFAAVAAAGNRESAAAQHAALAGDWTRAAADARLAGRLTPWAAEPLRTLAQTQMAAGDFDRAVATLHRAIARDPDNRALWLDLAVVTDGPEHARAVDRARALDPLDPALSELTTR